MDLGLILTFLVIFHLLPLFLTQEFNQPLDTCPKDFQCGNLGIMIHEVPLRQPLAALLWFVRGRLS